MSSVMLCSKCGGTVGTTLPGKKPCTCKQSSSAAVATAAKGAAIKRCVTCGKDVTHEKRMKDSSTGKYWCYDCGSKQPASQTQAIVCPICKKPMSPLSMYRSGDHYICQHCHDDKSAMNGKTGSKTGGGKLVMICAAVLLIAAVSAYLNGWLPI